MASTWRIDNFPTAAVALVRELILSDPDILYNTSKVIEGFGWDATIWPEKRLPTAVCVFALNLTMTDQVSKG